MAELTVGTARRNITPPVGAGMAGYGNRNHGAEAVHDELWVRALFIDDGNAQAALICRDLLDTDNAEMDLLAEVFEDRLGLMREQLFIANTHTHSGPSTGCDDDAENRDYVETLARICAGAVEEARGNARPATLAVAQRPVQCGINRRELRDGEIVLGVNPDGPCDTVVDVLSFADADGEPLATIFRHGVHGVVMGSDNYVISGDAPGAAEAFVESNLPGVGGFLAGASGNINAHPRGGFQQVAMLGRRLGAATVQGTTEADEPRSDVALATVRHEYELPVETLENAEDLRSEREDLEDSLERIEAGEDAGGLSPWRCRRRLRHVEAQLEAIEDGEEPTGLPTFAQVLALGDVALVGWPAEVFYQIAQQVREQSSFAHTLDVTHVNGSIGYVPVASAYEEGGYEIRARAHHRGLGITPPAEGVMVREPLQALERAREAVG